MARSRFAAATRVSPTRGVCSCAVSACKWEKVASMVTGCAVFPFTVAALTPKNTDGAPKGAISGADRAADLGTALLE